MAELTPRMISPFGFDADYFVSAKDVIVSLQTGDRVSRAYEPTVIRGTVRSTEPLELSFFGAVAVLVDWDTGDVSNLPSFELRKLTPLELLAEQAE